MQLSRSDSERIEISVVNKKHGATGQYIGRGSPLGNPFPIDENNSRSDVIQMYKVWLDRKLKERDQSVRDELNRLVRLARKNGSLNLVCFCSPMACHGDYIKHLLDDVINKGQNEKQGDQ